MLCLRVVYNRMPGVFMYQAYANDILNQNVLEAEADEQRTHQRENESPLYMATQRLVHALDRLEYQLHYNAQQQVASQHREPTPQQVAQTAEAQGQLQFFSQENELLRQEHANLNAAIAQLQHQYDDLHHVARHIYDKLDDSIRRLTQIIEQ